MATARRIVLRVKPHRTTEDIMSVLTISEPVALACSECTEGYYVETGVDRAACACGHEVVPSFDVARFLDHNEHMVWATDALGFRMLCYFTA